MIPPPVQISSVLWRDSHRAFWVIIVLISAGCLVPLAHAQAPADSLSQSDTSGTTAAYPSHAQVVRHGVGIATRKIFDGFPFVRPKTMWITPASGQKPNFWFEETASRELFDRGFVVQDTPGDDTAKSVLWAVRYRFDRFNLQLPKCARHSFLGRIWVERVFDLSLQLQVWDMESGQLLWSNSVDSASWTDWVPKRNLKELSDPSSPFLSPVPPVTTIERLAEPALITAAIGALTVLFFVVR